MHELRSLLPFLRPYLRTYALGLALVVVSNFFVTLGPRFLEHGIDALRAQEGFHEVQVAVALLLIVALLGGVARYGMRELLNSGSRRVETDLRDQLYQHLQRMSAEFYDRYPTGDVMARTTNDLLAVRMVAGPALMYLVDTSIRALLIAPAMLAISPRLTSLALLPLLGLPVIMVSLGGLVHRRSQAIQAHFSELTSHAHENLSGVRVVRAYRQEDAEIAHFRGLSEEYLRRNLGLAKVQGLFFPLLTLMGGLSAVAVLYVGGRLIMSGAVTVGEFVAFGVYLAMLVWPMIALGWAVNLVQRGAASMARINQLFAEPPAIGSPATPAALPPARGGRTVEFDGVWFRYPGVERGWVLENVSFRVEAGRSLAIVGPTGSGKSTLVDLIVRAHDPTRGAVRLDGVDIRQLDLATLRQAVGFVPQETFLFGETLRENVLLGAPDDGRLERVAEVSQLAEALPSLPNGFDTLLGERGINLSGGQKQRTAIARALAQDPPVFVLDDALSAVDAHTEARILAALRGALTGRTSLIVSHRLAAVRDADWILVLDEGRIVEQGVHADLIGRGGRYWELLRRQQLEEELEEESVGGG
ncbi:MAG TPA: ABC transporter ATP-binding protein [Gemmatimonadales bacterium]|jgi:ATP-binding cassette subfamily B protein|nr:ABC transporter ATP-binding protein [Gemmatimonadales bacterium]